jgi:hypothetical protein
MWPELWGWRGYGSLVVVLGFIGASIWWRATGYHVAAGLVIAAAAGVLVVAAFVTSRRLSRRR